MKKQLKTPKTRHQLTFKPETIRKLDERDLHMAVGGLPCQSACGGEGSMATSIIDA
jgi:hypothetical protein